VSTALTPALRDQHEQDVATVTKGISTFREVGEALERIRDCKTYLVTHSTFEEFCKETWSIGLNYAYKAIAAADAVRSLPPEICTMVQTERVARAVARVEPSIRVETVEKAVAHAKSEGRDRITARDVEKMKDTPAPSLASSPIVKQCMAALSAASGETVEAVEVAAGAEDAEVKGSPPTEAAHLWMYAKIQFDKLRKNDPEGMKYLLEARQYIDKQLEDTVQEQKVSWLQGEYGRGARLSVKLDYDGPKLLSVEPATDTGNGDTASLYFTSYASLERVLGCLSSAAQWKRLAKSVRDHIKGQKEDQP